jgi:lysophospholipase L1-like esterase
VIGSWLAAAACCVYAAAVMKAVLCFGDSNTWGFDPAHITSAYPRRFPADKRWTGVLARELGPEFKIIEEGQNGRTTVHDDPLNEARNGKAYLPACLESHKPLDLVVLMLGTNDLKCFFNAPAQEIANGAGILGRMILTGHAGPDNKPPRLLLMCPPRVGDLSHLPELEAKLPVAQARSALFPRYYSAQAMALGCDFLNTQDLIEPSPVDGIHLDLEAHEALGKAVAAKIREMLA